ncbi:MAG TPA: alpha/beta hydrolase [Acetobacteraceae bacterium]|nr:alpha/beta hydrolase [Acetobacteraceae bacterium]
MTKDDEPISKNGVPDEFTLGRRRAIQRGAAMIAAGAMLPVTSIVGGPALAASSTLENGAGFNSGDKPLGNYLKTKDGSEIFYKDWGTGQAIVFSHGWPLSADAWDAQMLFFGFKGYRVIAHDRRGHGRSSQPWTGYDNNTFADDLAELLEKLDLQRVILVAHSMGGGEIARYVGRHGTSRLARMVFIAAVPPLMLKTNNNPGGLPMSVFDGIRKGIVENRAQFYKDVSVPFFGYNRPNAKVSEGIQEQFWRLAMQSSIKGSYDCVKAFSEDDFTGDLKKIDVPTLFLHGEDDQIVPVADSSALSAKIVKGSTLKLIPGAPHGLCNTIPDQVDEQILAFIREA